MDSEDFRQLLICMSYVRPYTCTLVDFIRTVRVQVVENNEYERGHTGVLLRAQAVTATEFYLKNFGNLNCLRVPAHQ